MKYQPKQVIQHTFDADELQRRIENEFLFYETRTQTHRELGGLVKVSHGNATHFMHEVAEKVLAGYTFHDKSPVITTYPEFSAYYVKPESMQETDKEVIAEKIEKEYREELKALYETHVQAIVTETLEREERAAAKKAEAAKARRVEAARKEAIAALGVCDA